MSRGMKKFIRNMGGGAAGIDLVLMVIAADEGVMPQTKGASANLLASGHYHRPGGPYKIDLVEKDWLDLVRSKSPTICKARFLPAPPLCPFQHLKHRGILGCWGNRQTVRHLQEKTDDGIFRLPVDRILR